MASNTSTSPGASRAKPPNDLDVLPRHRPPYPATGAESRLESQEPTKWVLGRVRLGCGGGGPIEASKTRADGDGCRSPPYLASRCSSTGANTSEGRDGDRSLPLRVRPEPTEVELDTRHVAGDLGVVTRRDVEHVAGTDLQGWSRPPCGPSWRPRAVAEVVGLAGVGLGDGLDVVRPFPASSKMALPITLSATLMTSAFPLPSNGRVSSGESKFFTSPAIQCSFRHRSIRIHPDQAFTGKHSLAGRDVGRKQTRQGWPSDASRDRVERHVGELV